MTNEHVRGEVITLAILAAMGAVIIGVGIWRLRHVTVKMMHHNQWRDLVNRHPDLEKRLEDVWHGRDW